MGSNSEVWRKALLPSANVAQAIENLNEVSIKIVLVVSGAGVFEGTLSDGDIRRGLLKGLGLNSTIESIINRNALVTTPAFSHELVMQLMISNKIQQIPVVDERRQIVGLHLWDNINALPVRSNLMVIKAGGMGKRLYPFTEDCPKPLLPVAGKPILEHIISHAKLEGFSHFIISIYYLGDLIEAYFGNGDKLGVRIQYLRENSPLGTAGALSLLDPCPSAPFVVTNGDVMTDIRYGELLDFHIQHGASATMAIRPHEWQHPFGVVKTQGIEIIGLDEKPTTVTHINAGVYCLSPQALAQLERNQICDMPTLFQRLQSLSIKTVAYPMHEPWLDVGRPEDLNLIIAKAKNRKGWV